MNRSSRLSSVLLILIVASTPVFAADHTLNITRPGGGYIKVMFNNGQTTIYCGATTYPQTCSVQFPAGTKLTAYAVTSAGSKFLGWPNPDVCRATTAAQCSFTPAGNVALAADFESSVH